MSIKFHNGANDLLINAIAIGLTLFGMTTISGGISGGCINPAIGLVQTIFQNIVFNGYGKTWKRLDANGDPMKGKEEYFLDMGYEAIFIYIFAPLIGGIAAGLFQHINGWAQKSLEEAKKSYDEQSKFID